MLLLFYIYELLIIVRHQEGARKIGRKVVLRHLEGDHKICHKIGCKMFCELTKCRNIVLGPKIVIKIVCESIPW